MSRLRESLIIGGPQHGNWINWDRDYYLVAIAPKEPVSFKMTDDLILPPVIETFTYRRHRMLAFHSVFIPESWLHSSDRERNEQILSQLFNLAWSNAERKNS